MSVDQPTVIDRFAESLARAPDAVAVYLVMPDAKIEVLSYRDLEVVARRAACGLGELGLSRGNVVLLALPTCVEVLGLYLASLCTGVIPLILPEPRGPHAGELYADQAHALAARVGARWVLALPEARERLASKLRNAVDARQQLRLGEVSIELAARPEDAAHLQTSSGSTGLPKVAVVRNRNISANVQAIGAAIDQRDGDRVVSWLPLCHDMGLICVSCVLFWQRPLVLTDPANFARHPVRNWLQLLSSWGGTISAAPTSAYQICARLGRRRRFDDLDLSRWRVGFCGAEPVHPRTLAEFNAAFAPYGLRRETLLPVYGLAETTLAATIPRLGSQPRLDTIDSRALEEEQRAMPAEPGGRRSVTLVCVGRPLAGHDVRIVDAHGRRLPERQIGEIEVHGPSVVESYWGEKRESHKEVPGGSCRTGDLGYLDGGELFVTGRMKDIIIVRGRNLMPSQLEPVVAEIVANDIQNGVAAFGLANPDGATEDLHLMVESRDVPPPDRHVLEENVRHFVWEAFEVTGIYIHWVSKGSIPKTASGKIQHSQCPELLRESADALVPQ